MKTLYDIVTGLVVLLDIGLLLGALIAVPMWLKQKLENRHMSRSEEIEGGFIFEIDDPFGEESGFPMNDGLKRARDWLSVRFHAGEGTFCPCCGQMVQKYRRQIYKGMVKSLDLISKHPGTAPEKLRATGGGDFAKLVYWGLLEQDKERRWHCTEQGRAFLAGELFVPKYVYIYNAKKFGRSEDMVNVDQCYGERFVFEDTLRVPPEVEPAEAAE